MIRFDPTQPLASNQIIVPQAGNFSFPLGITIVTAQDVPTLVPGPSPLALLTTACLFVASLRRLGSRS